MYTTQGHFEQLLRHPMRGGKSIFMREIMFDSHNRKYVDLSSEYDFEYISNIYSEVDPLYIELFSRKLEDMIIKDKNGKLTLLTLMPLVE